MPKNKGEAKACWVLCVQEGLPR